MDGPGATAHKCIAAIRVPPIAFPCSLDTKAMNEYVTRHFAWDQRGIASPPSPLPKDFQTFCPSFELAVTQEAAEYYEHQKLPQVIFYVMFLNEAKRLGVLHGRALRSLESALTELHWSAFESWIWLFSDRIYKPRFRSKDGEVVKNTGKASSIPIFLVSMAFPFICNTREMANYARESFIWCWRSASHPPHPLPEDFQVLCPHFSLSDAEGVAADFELPEIVQATFYAMLLNEAVDLGVAHNFTTESVKSSLIGLRWSTFEV
ncbi:hypothetical protein Cgig2_011314 [Carnegiea gigantea]|uniref:Uncharacterized protein n=1 Tax=Carnegiea gigantea TaxID=171969 RepID=A0A9Q1GL62_9CARY|nr:hypothetical protein Cgig2_011314 [Carnegiea gigantea]